MIAPSFASLPAPPPPATLSMYTRKNRCLPIFHSTSTISSPSERATRSAAARIFSKSTQRLLDRSRSAVHSNRPNKKVGSRPLSLRPASERSQSIFPLHCKCKIRGLPAATTCSDGSFALFAVRLLSGRPPLVVGAGLADPSPLCRFTLAWAWPYSHSTATLHNRMNPRLFFRIALLPCLLLIGARLTAAENIKNIHPTGCVTDLDSIIATDAKARLESLCSEVELKTGAQMAIVTVSSLDGESVETYAVDVYKQLGIGKKKDNRGVLLLVAPHERKYRIEVGYGLEPVINDARAGDAGRAMVPYLRQSDYSKAAEIAAWQLARYIAADSGVTLSGQQPAGRIRSRDDNGGIPGIWFLLGLVLFFIVIASLSSRGGGSGGSGLLWFVLGTLLGSSQRSSGGGWGGGGWGGGGF